MLDFHTLASKDSRWATPQGPEPRRDALSHPEPQAALGRAAWDTGGSFLPPALTSKGQREPLAGALGTTSTFSSVSWEPGGRRRLRSKRLGMLCRLIGPLKYGDIAE